MHIPLAGWRGRSFAAVTAAAVCAAAGLAFAMSAVAAPADAYPAVGAQAVADEKHAALDISLMILLLIFMLPLLLRAINVNRPLTANADATRFKGKYRRRQLTHVTGQVLGSQGHTEVWGGARVSVGSAHHETMRLLLADGRQTDAGVVDYDVAARPGDVISVWYAHKGRKANSVAVLNHTTNQQSITTSDVYTILEPHVAATYIYSAFILCLSMVLSFIGGFGWPFVLSVVVMFTWALGWRHVRTRFARKGIRPMWNVGNAEAKAF